MREISSRMSDRDLVDLDEEDDTRSFNSLSIQNGLREKN